MDVTVNRFLKIVLSIMFLLAIGWVVVELSSILIIFIIGALLAYILDPITSFLEYKGLSRTSATAVIFLCLALLLFIFIYFIVPPIIDQIKVIQHNLGSGKSTETINRIEEFIRKNLPMLKDVNLDLQNKLNTAVNHFSNSIFSLVGSVISIITTLVIIPFVVFFLLKDGRALIKSMVSIIPNRYFEITLNLIYKTDKQIGGYLRGQFFDALIIGFLSVVALWALNVPYFLLIGAFAGLANMVPYIGPLTGAVIAILVVTITNGAVNQMLMVAGAFALIQLLDNVLVQPIVVARSVQMHPLLVIFAVIAGGQFFGVIGMFLAVPAAAILKVFVLEIYYLYKKVNFA
ncbi:MAG: AI-2E family transporter [Calditrichaeota bacterium]|nr:AI-2E family transporter [Calditrichota bacterium]